MYRVIFEHHPKVGQVQSFIEKWQSGSDIIQTYPGSRGTLLFQSIDNPDVYFAMAEWESKEARANAMSEISKRSDAQEILHAHEQFVDSYSVLASAEMIASSLPRK